MQLTPTHREFAAGGRATRLSPLSGLRTRRGDFNQSHSIPASHRPVFMTSMCS